MVAGSSGSQWKSRKPLAPEEREQAEHDTRLAIYRLQHTAYANLRSAIANVAIFFGFVGVYTIIVGAADGPRLIPTAACVLAGVSGACYYPARQRPKLAVNLLLAATALSVIALASLVAVVLVLDS